MNLHRIILLAALIASVFSCKKTLGPVTASRDDRLTAVVGQLRDSMAVTDFSALDTTKGYWTGRFVRLAFRGMPLTDGFVLARVDTAGRVLAGSIVELGGMGTMETALGGSVRVRSLGGAERWSSTLMDGYAGALHPDLMRGVTTMGTDETYEFRVDPGVMPVVLVIGYTDDGGGGDGGLGAYLAYDALLNGASGSGSALGGSYGPVGGGGSENGGGGGGSSGTLTVETEYDAALTIVNVQQVLNCFGNTHVSDAGAVYTLSLCADVPVNADPDASATLSPGVSAGHSFLMATKTSGGVSVTQCIGFYPVQTPSMTEMLDAQPSAIKDNGGHEINAMVTRSLTAAQFAAFESSAETYAQHSYSLTTYNCTDYAVNVWNSTGAINVSLYPLTVSAMAPGGNSIEKVSIQNTPQGLFDLLKAWQSNGVSGVQLDLSGNLKAPVSEGQCPN